MTKTAGAIRSLRRFHILLPAALTFLWARILEIAIR
jgi:hypothetical protein